MSRPDKDLFQDDARREEARLNKEALVLLRYLKMTMKVTKIYDPGNQIVQEQIRLLFSLLQTLVQQEKEAVLLLRQTSLFFNGSRVRFSFSNYDLVKSMTGEMMKRDIGLLRFLPGLSEEELKSFLLILAKKRPAEESLFDGLIKDMQEKRISHIEIEKIAQIDVFTGNEEDAVKIFFLGIAHLKEIFGRLMRGETLSLNMTRRLMHSLFNHISHNEAFALGLTTIKNFDDYTLNHSVNVCILAIALGRRLGLEKHELTDLGISAFFHDYGKMEIPKEILDKPGKLEAEERALMECHSQIGAQKLLRLKEVSPVPVGAINVAIEHHVREDLTGYPRYHKKKTISLFSKIVRMCDIFDALSTPRPYRDKTFTRDEVLRMMMAESGDGFNPILLKVFVQMLGLYPVGTLVQLDTKELAIVFEPNPDPALALRPKVKMITDREGHKIDGEVVDTAAVHPETNNYERSIIRSLDPAKYGIHVADYFLARGQVAGSREAGGSPANLS
jgi:HD-GYP domain-containing protein (c-di-GMP phosphodiesterase class II)